MARAVTIGNGSLLVGLDHRGQVRDFYFPHVGHANHVSGASGSYTHRIGVWVEGVLRWLSHSSWNITVDCSEATSGSSFCAYNSELGVRLRIVDVVHNEQNIFLRKIVVTNERDSERDIRVFFGQEFRISESRRGDTAYYDPRVGAVIHYKGHDAFLINAYVDGVQFKDYSIGLFAIEGKRGTYADAEDGVLSQNPIEHGSVDSVIGVSLQGKKKKNTTLYYWIAVGTSISEACKANEYILEETPERLLTSAERYWHAWLEKEFRNLSKINTELQTLYRRSLYIMRVHADNGGGIIASSDTDILNQGRDTYTYVWPRDAAIIANALDRAGYVDTTQRFFSFIAERIEDEGYLMHKYRVDGVLGSSWHPWVHDGVSRLPIQEDETAIVLFMLLKHYQSAKDLEFIEALYNPFIEPSADFMCGYVEAETHLPQSSYDLWEEKYGTSTYTVAAVYGALNAAAEISALLGKRENAQKYRNRAFLLKQALITHLYSVEQKMFVKLVRHEGDRLAYDTTIDMSSFHGIIRFGVLDPFDKRVQNAYAVVKERLQVPGEFGGYMRYEGDGYYRTSVSAPPNAWCITTLWMAQYYIASARTKDDLKKAYALLMWVYDRAAESGILPEQIHPHTGEHLSTSPLVWSHAEYVITVDEYLKKLASFE